MFFSYLAGRLNIISSTEAKGLGTFVGNFALPSLIFLSLSKLQWNTVNWTFLISILAGKAIVFFSVVLIALLVIKPLNLAKAGLLAIFCTQVGANRCSLVCGFFGVRINLMENFVFRATTSQLAYQL